MQTDRFLAACVVLWAVACAGVLRAQDESGLTDDREYAALITPLLGTQPAHWRVIWHSDPQTKATIAWSTFERGREHRVHLSRTPFPQDATAFERTLASGWSGPYTPGDKESKSPGAHFHHARVEGLEPGTRYWFIIESDGQRSRVLHFDTAPQDGCDFEVLYGGDSRTAWRDRCRVNLLIAALAADERILCLVHGGDYVTHGTDSRQWLTWLGHHELTTTASGRVLPIVPARGNHDHGPNYGEVFDSPGTERGAWFRTDLSSDVALLNLDTNASALGDQLVWLESALEAARSKSRWLLLNYHRPMFPAVKSASPAAPHWVPLFERHDVDLVFESDGHCMKRTAPIRDGAIDPTGVTYIGEGGMGVPQREPDGSRWYFEGGGWVGRGHHMTRVSFSEEEIVTRFVVLDGSASSLVDAKVLVTSQGPWRHTAEALTDRRWTESNFDDSAWLVGAGPFGFGAAGTDTSDLRGKSARLLVRTQFTCDETVSNVDRVPVLVVDYDDAFIAYVDGKEVARCGINERGVWEHKSGVPEYFVLHDLDLAAGSHVLALEGHNRRVDSSSFHLDAKLVWASREEARRLANGWSILDEHRLRVRAPAAAQR